MEPIWIELEGKKYDLRKDIDEVAWDGKEDEDDTRGYYQAEILVFITKDEQYISVYKDELDAETLEYVNQFVDPM